MSKGANSHRAIRQFERFLSKFSRKTDPPELKDGEFRIIATTYFDHENQTTETIHHNENTKAARRKK